jgi:hypothetical protein
MLVFSPTSFLAFVGVRAEGFAAQQSPTIRIDLLI